MAMLGIASTLRQRSALMTKRFSWTLLVAMLMVPTPLFASDLTVETVASPQRLFQLDAGLITFGVHANATIHIADSWTLEGSGNVFIGAFGYSAALGRNYYLYDSRGSDGAGAIVELTPALGWFKMFNMMGGDYEGERNQHSGGNSTTGILAQVSFGVHYYSHAHFGWHARLSGSLWANPDTYGSGQDWYMPSLRLTTGPSF